MSGGSTRNGGSSSMNRSGRGPASRQRGWWIPYTFVAGFLVVLGANGALLYFATTTFSGLSTRHAYVEGLAYNDKVAAAQAQAALGWTWQLDLLDTTPLSAGDPRRRARVRATGTDDAGHPLDGARLTAEFRRPTVAGLDQTVTFAPVGPGTYEAVLTLPRPGQWDMRLTARRGDDIYRLRRRLMAE